jgi:ribosome-associated translation inhibitor RaiA
MYTKEFDYRFFNETDQPDDPLREEARTQLLKLAGDHKDIIGASVALEELSSSVSPHRYQARVIAFVRPENIAATEKAENVEAALNGALDAVVRQVREKRARLRDEQRKVSVQEAAYEPPISTEEIAS